MYSVPGETGWLSEMIKRYLSIHLSIIFYTVLITVVSELLLHVWSPSHFGTELVSTDSETNSIFRRAHACGRDRLLSLQQAFGSSQFAQKMNPLC